LFDVYRSDASSESRSLAFRLRLQAADRTLTDADIAEVRDKCIAGAGKLGAQLR
jgi:phenylalanyl-tRNA synthetase beta chain